MIWVLRRRRQGMKYKTEKDLNEVYRYFDEVDLALSDKTRTINDSDLSDKIAKGAASFFAARGIVGVGTVGAEIIGMSILPIVPILLSPTALIGVTVLGRFVKRKKEEEKLRRAKELAYKEAIAKQNAIIKELKKESYADKERMEYLVGLIQCLQETILELQNELKKYQ